MVFIQWHTLISQWKELGPFVRTVGAVCFHISSKLVLYLFIYFHNILQCCEQIFSCSMCKSFHGSGKDGHTHKHRYWTSFSIFFFFFYYFKNLNSKINQPQVFSRARRKGKTVSFPQGCKTYKRTDEMYTLIWQRWDEKGKKKKKVSCILM